MGLGLVLVLIGVILIGISAFWEPVRPSFWRLGWAFILFGTLVVGHVQLN